MAATYGTAWLAGNAIERLMFFVFEGAALHDGITEGKTIVEHYLYLF